MINLKKTFKPTYFYTSIGSDGQNNYIVTINDLVLKTNYYTYDSESNKFTFVN